MVAPVPALQSQRFLRSVEATHATRGKPTMKLLDLVAHVRRLSEQAPYAIVGGLAQILWARKSHTDDIDFVLDPESIASAARRIQENNADAGWAIPVEGAYEADAVFEVWHLTFEGAVVDLLAFRDLAFNSHLIATAVEVPDLDGHRFIRPELLLVTQLLRPGPTAALAAIELVLARRAHGDFDLDEARTWAAHLGRSDRLEKVIAQSDALKLV